MTKYIDREALSRMAKTHPDYRFIRWARALQSALPKRWIGTVRCAMATKRISDRCGAEILEFITPERAIEAWNRRCGNA